MAGWVFKFKTSIFNKQMTSTYSYTCVNRILNVQSTYYYLYTSVNTSGSHSTLPGVNGKIDSNRMLVSHKESAVLPSELGGSDTGQLGPPISPRVSNRFYPHPTAVIPTTSNSSVTGQACSGDTGGSETAIQGDNNRNCHIINKLCLPDFPGKKKEGKKDE